MKGMINIDINIRESIKKNFHDVDKSEIEKSINEAVEENDEITLPGLGYFFEILWINSSSEVRELILDIIHKYI